MNKGNLKNLHLYVDHDVVNDFLNLKEEYQKILDINLTFKNKYRRSKVPTNIIFEFFVETLKHNKEELEESFVEFYKENYGDELL